MSTDQSSTNTADDYLYTIKRISDDVYCIVENDQFNWNPLLYFICTSGKGYIKDKFYFLVTFVFLLLKFLLQWII